MCDPGSWTLRAFVDTDSAAVREWAETVYETYREESVPMEEYTRQGFQQALAGSS